MDILKKTIKRILPERIIYKIKLFKIKNNRKKKYGDIEKIVDKKYKNIFNRNINWENPTTYTEKLNITKIYGSSDLKTRLTDKIEVRSWVEKNIGKEYLVPIYGVYNSFEEINFKSLPQKFVIKCNHDSGSVSLINKNFNIKKEKIKYDFFLKRNYSLFSYEMHYNNIKPKIIIEKYMGDEIQDYKFLCFNGKIYYCWVDFNRFSNHKRNVYDLEWNLQEFNQKNYGNYLEDVKCPEKFNEMIRIVEKLCKGFDHVRVDLYLIKNKIYFGELTFTNGSGFEKFEPDEWDYKLGKLWEFSSERDLLKNEKIKWRD